MPAGSERGAAVVGVIGGRIVVAGGLRGGAVAEVSAYDPVADVWDRGLPPLPEPRDHACGGAIGDALYVAGGRRGSIGSIAATTYAWTAAGGWSTRAAMPTARGGHRLWRERRSPDRRRRRGQPRDRDRGLRRGRGLRRRGRSLDRAGADADPAPRPGGRRHRRSAPRPGGR
jgi:hypothetical protein